MSDWRQVFREGIVPLLSTQALESLRVALVNDDSRLIQGALCSPPTMPGLEEWPLEGGCALVFPALELGEIGTVAEASGLFARLCLSADKHLDNPGGVNAFLNAYDDMPRADMRRELAEEVSLALAGRES